MKQQHSTSNRGNGNLVIMRRLFVAACITAAFIAGRFASADEVTRRSTKKSVKGKIEKITAAQIVIKARTGGNVTIPVDDVVRVRFDGEPASLNLARTSELNGALDRALDGFTKAKEANKDDKKLATELDFLIARTYSRMASASAEKSDKAVELLTAFTKTHTNNIRFYEATSLLSSIYLQKGDIAKARETVAPLNSAPVKSLKMTAQIIEGRALLAEQNPAEAAKAFQAAAAMAGNEPSEKAKGLEGLLGSAICQQRQQQFDQAIATLDQVLEKTSIADTAVQAEAYLRRGDVYRSQDKNKEAIFEYLHVDLLFSAHKNLHAEALFNLAQLWSLNGHADRAAEAKAALTSQYGASAWAKKIAGG